MLSDAPFDFRQAPPLTNLHDQLRRAGYTQEALAALAAGSKPARGLDHLLMRSRTATPTPLNTLTRLFTLGDTVPLEHAAAAMAPLHLEPLTTLGLLHTAGDGIRAEVRLTPFEQLLIPGDFNAGGTGHALPANHVLGIGAAAVTLAGLVVRRDVDTALDIGTGSGIQVLLAAAHAKHCLGTDINPRALHLADFAARLNGIDNVEFAEGSLFAPAAGRRFDLIVANPPFVISPETRYVFRDSDLPGDEISEQLVRECPNFLAEGGVATILLNWHHRHENDWVERPRQWVSESGCDAWILCFHTGEPAVYALEWLRSGTAADDDALAPRLDEWLNYYEQEGIGRISAGAVILRRRNATNWLRTDRLPEGHHMGACSDHILQVFAAEDLLADMTGDEELLEQRLVLDPEHRLEHWLQAEDGRWQLRQETLRRTRGFSFSGNVDWHVAQMLAACDGERPLRELLPPLADALQTDLTTITPACLKVVRKLLRAGLLRPAPTAGDG